MIPDQRFQDDLDPTSVRIEPAQVVADPAGVNWDQTCDVLVVGVGLAGVCAALRAAEEPGLDVLAVDRGTGGGASQLSGGSSTWVVVPGPKWKRASSTRLRIWRTI